MPQWTLNIQVSYTNKGSTDWTGNAVCIVYYPSYSLTQPVGTSSKSVTIPAGSSLVVSHSVTTDPNVNIPGKAQIKIETYLQDPTTGAIYNYNVSTFLLPDENLIDTGSIQLVSVNKL